MLEAGEDPLYVARRLIRFASEDIGMADSRALEVAVAAYQASHFIGMPECNVTLTHAVVYLSMAPKSNSLYVAYEHAKTDAQKMLAEPVPLVIRNAPTRLMKDLHYGEGYQYAHNAAEKLTDMQCLPDSLQGRTYYRPTDQGSEAGSKSAWSASKPGKPPAGNRAETTASDLPPPLWRPLPEGTGGGWPSLPYILKGGQGLGCRLGRSWAVPTGHLRPQRGRQDSAPPLKPLRSKPGLSTTLGGDVRTSQVSLRSTYSVEFRIRETRGKIKTYTS